MTLEFSPHIFEKYSNIKFRENSSIESRIVPHGRRTGRHSETNVRFSQFWGRAYKPHISLETEAI